MLSLAKAAKDYYLQKLGEISPREDYYLRGGTAAGRWCGSAAAELGLSGGVSAEGLVRLFDGEHPGTGEQLGRRLRRDGVAAWDVTFSADKSVSLLWALGDEVTRKEVVAAFEEATAQALGYLESVASATRGAAKTAIVDNDGNPMRNPNGTPKYRVETWPIASSGYVAAAFTEYTSRADDPQLHTHVVIANKVQGVDGVWRTVDGKLLYRHQLAAGYLHEAVLRHELTQRLGVQWQPVRNGMADIAGFTRHQIEAFSQRRTQLEAWCQDHDLPDTPAARQVAVLATRTAKTAISHEVLEAEWQRRAAAVGLTQERIDRLVDRSTQVTSADPAALFDTLVSPDGLTARSSTFAVPEVIQHIAAAMPEGGTRSDVESLAEAFLSHGDVLPVGVVDQPPVRSMRTQDATAFSSPVLRSYTTTELLATERRVIEQATAGVDADRWAVPPRLIEAHLRRHHELTEGQRQMVRRFASSGSLVDVGIGPAGSGKTAVMAVINQLAMLTGTPVVGTALAARTAAGLQADTGIPSTTVAGLLSHAPGPDIIGAVVVVDEAGMVGTRQLAVIVDMVDAAGGKLILVGDDHQLPEIEAGGLFRALVDRLPAVELTDNVRQHAAWERQALAELRHGSIQEAMDVYRERRRLHIGRTPGETISRAVSDWYRHLAASGDITAGLLIAHDNETVADLNQRARSRLVESQRIHGPTLEAGEMILQAGDRILCRRNEHRLDLLNGDLGTVTNLDPDNQTVTVQLDREPGSRQLPGWYLKAGDVAYGYALTAHKAQGITTDRTFTVITSGTDREWTYVAMSRGRTANTLYLATPGYDDAGCTHLTHDSRAPHLSSCFEGSSAQSAAIDQISRSPGEQKVEELSRVEIGSTNQQRRLDRATPGTSLTAAL